MLVVSVLALMYAFFYLTGGMAELGQSNKAGPQGSGEQFVSAFEAAEGKNDYKLFERIQPFNDALMYCGLAMVLMAVLLFVTSCNSRRKYYISNYVVTGACALGDIVISIVLMVLNGSWKSEFLNVDFDAWYKYNEIFIKYGQPDAVHYSESVFWFDIGFVVYALVIVASLVLIFNLVWKILLMRGEKKLLSGGVLKAEGGAQV